jgi:enterochelin esterase family protein
MSNNAYFWRAFLPFARHTCRITKSFPFRSTLSPRVKKANSLKAILSLVATLAAASTPAIYGADKRPTPPTRSPTAPGTPPLTPVGVKPGEAGPLHGAAGVNPPADAEGDFLIGPDYVPAPELTAVEGVPKGRVERFTMKSEDSKFYPGITKVPPGGPADYMPPDLTKVQTYPKPYTRVVTVYVPAQYEPGTPAPVLVKQDGADETLPIILDNLIAQHRVPAMIAVMIQNGGGDAQGSERGLEYDTLSGRYAEFVESEVFPLVESTCHVKITKDPEARAAMGSSSGGAAAFTMAWYHPELYHRVLTTSGTYVNQASPFNPEAPHGAWEYHEHFIAESPRKPIRIWLEVGDRDNLNSNSLRDGMHDWVEANNRMATVLKAKGYHYQYVFALNAGHSDRAVKAQTFPEALEWLWKDYPVGKKG